MARIPLVALCLLSACTSAPTSQPDAGRQAVAQTQSGFRTVLIPDVPHVRQDPDFCGEAAAASWLQSVGKAYDQGDVFTASGMDPARGMGVTTRELAAALKQIGFSIGDVWYTARADAAEADLAQRFAELHADLARGVPSIVCMHYGPGDESTEHFRLVLGYDAEKDELVYHEPAEDDGAYRRMARTEFLKLWPLHYKSDEWTVIRMRLEAGALADPPRQAGPSPADYAQHVMALREKLPSHYTVIIEPPFVVVGDDSPERVKQHAEGTVRWAVQMLKQDYFAKDPERILDIWLFKNKQSYNANVAALFGEEPSTPYGYYSSRNRALVMNIATGGGTLVHEIVHPFMEANVPDCPPWLNEGLGSLYEQSSSRDGHIIGLTNWRLAGLQREIKNGNLPTFAELTAMGDRAFYGDDRGDNYAHARYLLYYLQERGLLLPFYRDYLAHRGEDPSGLLSLKRTLAENDLVDFQRRWEAFVLSLSFP